MVYPWQLEKLMRLVQILQVAFWSGHVAIPVFDFDFLGIALVPARVTHCWFNKEDAVLVNIHWKIVLYGERFLHMSKINLINLSIACILVKVSFKEELHLKPKLTVFVLCIISKWSTLFFLKKKNATGCVTEMIILIWDSVQNMLNFGLRFKKEQV